MKKKDPFFALVISVLPIGLGHFYLGEKKKGLIILILQFFLMVLSGVAIGLGKGSIATALVAAIIIVGVWAAIDTLRGIKMLNEYVEKKGKGSRRSR